MAATTRETVLTRVASALSSVCGTVDRQYQQLHSADITYPFASIVDVHTDHEFLCKDLALSSHTIIITIAFEPTDDTQIATELNTILDDVRNALRVDTNLNAIIEHLFEMATEVNENMQEGQANVFVQLMLTYVEDFAT